MNSPDLILRAHMDHKAVGLNFPDYFSLFLRDKDKYFLKGDTWLIMAHDTGEVWHVHYAVSLEENPLALFLSLMPHWREWVSWARPKKGRPQARLYRTERLIEHARHQKPDFFCRW